MHPVLSADGRTLAFLSTATGLVPGVATFDVAGSYNGLPAAEPPR